MAQPSSTKPPTDGLDDEGNNESTAATVNTDAITDGRTDIASTIGLEQMRVEAVGRVPFQQLYLWTTSEDDDSTKKKKATNTKYEPEVDGPAFGGTHLLPLREELIPDAKAKLNLAVGLVIGADPSKYKARGQSRNKDREEARKKRGVLGRHPEAMRAFIPVSDYIQPQAKFYVACKTGGRPLLPSRHPRRAHLLLSRVLGGRRRRCQGARAADATDDELQDARGDQQGHGRP